MWAKCGQNGENVPDPTPRSVTLNRRKTPHLRGVSQVGDIGLEPMTSALSRRQSNADTRSFGEICPTESRSYRHNLACLVPNMVPTR